MDSSGTGKNNNYTRNRGTSWAKYKSERKLKFPKLMFTTKIRKEELTRKIYKTVWQKKSRNRVACNFTLSYLRTSFWMQHFSVTEQILFKLNTNQLVKTTKGKGKGNIKNKPLSEGVGDVNK